MKTLVKRSIDQKLGFDARNERTETGELATKSRSAHVVLKEDQENATNGKQKDNVREEIIAVSGTMRKSAQNRHQSPLHSLIHRHKKDGGRFSRRNSLRGCKYNTSNDVFSRCKRVHKMATGKK